MKTKSTVLSLLSLASAYMFAAEEQACSSGQSQIGPLAVEEYLSNLIQESYKQVGLQKTLEHLSALRAKLSNDNELALDVDAIINKINTKQSISESITFPTDLSKMVLDYADTFYDEFETFKVADKEISKLAWSPDGKRLAMILSQNKNIKIFNIETQEIKILTGHTENVEKIAWSHDGQKLASSAQRTIRIWDVNSGQNLKAFGKVDHFMAVSCIAFSPDGKYLASGDYKGKIFLWDANTFKLSDIYNVYEKDVVEGICWSPDSKHLATPVTDWNRIVLLNIYNKTKRTIQCTSELFRPRKFSKIICTLDGKYIITGSSGLPNKLIWRLTDFNESGVCNMQDMLVKEDHYIRELDNTYDTGAIWHLSCTGDSSIFVTSDQYRITKVWDIENRELIQELTNSKNPITSVACSPVANIFAVGHANGEVKLYGKTFG